MHPNRTRSQSANDRFWDRYIQAVEKQGVSERAAHWYVKRAEQYLKSLPDKRLAQHTPEDVDGYLRRLGRLDGIEDWQFRQAVDAIQTLFRVAGLATADRVDWGFWQASAQSLMPDHPTLARETQPQEKPAVSGDRFKAKRNAPSPLDAIRAAHGPLLERLAAEIRRRRYSIRTEQAYAAWVCRFIAFQRGKDPAVLGAAQVVAFLEHLAVKGNVAASTQNQALNALMFLYKNILDQPLGELDAYTRPKRPKRLPVVLDRSEVRRLLDRMEGVQHLMASLLYGTGMRLMECVRLRVQDVDFNYHQLVVRDGKGQKDRVVPLPLRLELPLREQLEQTRAQHQEDLDLGFGEVFLPDALARKWTNAAREWIWQYAFPSGQLSVDPRSGKTRRHHMHENGLQKAVKVAAQKAGITKKVNCHSLRDNRGQTTFFRARRATTTRRTHTTRMVCAPYCLSRMSLAATRKSTGSSEPSCRVRWTSSGSDRTIAESPYCLQH